MYQYYHKSCGSIFYVEEPDIDLPFYEIEFFDPSGSSVSKCSECGKVLVVELIKKNLVRFNAFDNFIEGLF